MPVFHFAKIYGDIALVTCYHHEPSKFVWEAGRDFKWTDLNTFRRGKLATQDRYMVYSLAESLKRLYLLILFYIIVAWYFDNVLSSNRGAA